jgi:porphobilinogen synthase
MIMPNNKHHASQFPAVRMRRMRRDAFSRAMMRETVLTPSDLIYPVFVLDGHKQCEKVASMPGVERLSIDLLLPVAEECVELGIPALALFPVIHGNKTPDGIEATNPEGLIPRVVRELKARFPRAGHPDRRRAGPVHQPRPGRRHQRQGLRAQRRNHHHAGAPGADARRRRRRHRRAVGHDGRPHRRDPRGAGERQHIHTRIMAYSAKYASAFYGPFRDAVGSSAALGKATRAPTRWTRPTPTRRCAKWRSISPRAPTW